MTKVIRPSVLSPFPLFNQTSEFRTPVSFVRD